MMKLTRTLRIAGLTWAVVVPASSGASAQEGATPTQYQFTLQKVELCQDAACAIATELGEGARVFDIGSDQADSGQSVGNFASEFSLPPNQTFTHMRITLSRTFQITATAPTENSGDGADCVTGNVAVASATDQAVSTVTTGAAVATQNFVVPDTTAAGAPGNLADTFAANGVTLVDANTMTVIFALTAPFTTGATIPTFDIAFDVSNTMTFTQTGTTTCSAVFGPPKVTFTIQ